MEELKPLNDVMSADPRMTSFIKLDRATGGFISVELEDYHRSLSAIRLDQAVPDDVRSYFETAKNVCLYGWFVYGFFAVAEFLSYTAIEFALRSRLYPSATRKVPGLKRLLVQAVAEGLISDEGFASIQRQRRSLDRLKAAGARFDSKSPAKYTNILVDTVPNLRNSFAHPSFNTILTPGDAISSLTRSGELINQLFAADSPKKTTTLRGLRTAR
jgi:hypothetical protein